MFVSFFEDWENAVWVDCSSNPDCIFASDVDFNPDIQIASLINKNWKYSVKIEDKPLPSETNDQKHSRIYQSIISTKSLEWFDLEWENFSDFEIWEIITARVFGWNPHAQSALQAKMIAMLLSKNMNPDLIEKAQEIEIQINAVRNLFNIGNL